MKLDKSKLALAVAAALMLTGQTIAAEEKVDETAKEQENKGRLNTVLITAQKVPENIQDVPISVTAFDGAQIKRDGIENLVTLSQYVPNLTISKNAINTNIYMRGIGSGNNRAFEQSVGMFIDGVYMGRGRQFRAPFLDLERAEILRGPQGILFGKNTIAGTINLVTAKAEVDVDFEGSLSAEWDPKYGGQTITGIFSGSVTDDLGLRLAIKDSSSDGYTYNTMLDRDEAATNEQIVRLSANWQPNEILNVHAKIEHSEFKVKGSSAEFIGLNPLDGLAGFMTAFVIPAYDSEFEATANHQRSSDSQQAPDSQATEADNFALNIDYTLDAGVLTFVSGYSTYETFDVLDADFGPSPFITTTDIHDFKQFSQEIRFASQDNEKFNYITGAFYQKQELQLDVYSNMLADPIMPYLNQVYTTVPAALVNPALPGFLSDFFSPDSIARAMDMNQETETQSVFFQGTYNVSDDFRLVLGGRYTNEQKDATRQTIASSFDSTTFSTATPLGLEGTITGTLLGVLPTVPFYNGQRDESQFTPSLKFQYDFSNDIMFYGTAEKGFKSGGINAAPDVTVASNEFEPEKATGFEFGIKSDLLDGSARLNAAVFSTSFDDMQVTSWTGFGFEVSNAAESVTQGVEVDGQLILNDNWMLSGSMSYLDAHYKDYAGGACTAEVLTDPSDGRLTCDLTDKDLPYAPSKSASIFVDYNYRFSDLEFSASLNVNYSDSFHTAVDLDKNLQQEAATKVNLRLGLIPMSDKWDIAIIARNLTDETTFSAGADTPLISGGYAGYIEAPRTIVLQGTVRF